MTVHYTFSEGDWSGGSCAPTMGPVEQVTRGSATRIWRRWVLLAVAEEVTGTSAVTIGPHGATRSLRGFDVAMKLTAGDRLVVVGQGETAPLPMATLVDTIPDWAVSDVDVEPLMARGIRFALWHQRGEWNHVPDVLPTGARAALAEVATDEAVTTRLRALFPDASPGAAAAALAMPDLGTLAALVGPAQARAAALAYSTAMGNSGMLSTAARQHLLDVVRAHMRGADEIGDRGLQRRPALLRDWSSVNANDQPFSFAVHADQKGFYASATNRGLTRPQALSLTNVLAELRRDETDDSGSWLFAAVTSNGRSARLVRAFDHWPDWFAASPEDRIPSLGALSKEMAGRDPSWRPAWAALLPPLSAA